jgi:hypothetical protein
MKSIYLFSALLVLVLTACSTTKKGKDRTEVLFDGHTLKGWEIEHGGEWIIEDHVLIGRNGTNWTTNPEKSGSWLRTAKQYGDFILELDYAISSNSNSGIFIRSSTEKNPAFTGYEMQITADAGRTPTKHSGGGLYDVVAATKNVSKPAGEWNHVRIVVHGTHVHIEMNGEPILDYHDADRSERGYIGLQNHDARSVVKFKNIEITPL